MKIPTCFFLLLEVAFAILCCENKSAQSANGPEPVRFVPKSEDSAIIERGIDAIPEDDGIYIEWYLPEDTEINRYTIYRKSEIETQFRLIDTVEDTFYIDHNIELNRRFYYFVLSMNYDNQKSVSSDTLSYKLLSKPIRLSPSGIISNSVPVFTWEDTNQPHEYIIRVQRLDNEEIIWIAIINAIYGTEHQQTSYNSNDTAAMDQLMTGIPYQWRVDVIAPEDNSGSESVSTYFEIQ